VTRLRVVVVDDEPLARRRLAAMVERTELAEVVGEAASADDAAALIARVDPDVALVDIRMPPGPTGLDLARRLGARPIVVFTTAHGEHAVDAFDTAAADYLMKPVEAAKLVRALDRAAARIAAAPPAPANEPRITARAGDVVRVFAARAIPRFHAGDKYTVFVVDGVEHLIEESLGALEDRLAAWGFVRVHRAELVQLASVRALHAGDAGAELELVDGTRVPVSRRLLASVRRRLAC
jgi:DNA-binding LytR/AlgR family response regulator